MEQKKINATQEPIINTSKERIVGYIDIPVRVIEKRKIQNDSLYQNFELKSGRYNVIENYSALKSFLTVSLLGKVVDSNLPSILNEDKKSTVNNEIEIYNLKTNSIFLNNGPSKLFGYPFTLTELDVNKTYEERVDSKFLETMMRIKFKNIQQDYISAGSKRENLLLIEKKGNVIAFLDKKTKEFILITKDKLTNFDSYLSNNDNDIHSISRTNDGSYQIQPGKERLNKIIRIYDLDKPKKSEEKSHSR